MTTLEGLGASPVATVLSPFLPTEIRLRTALSNDSVLMTKQDMLDIIDGVKKDPKAPSAGTRLLHALQPTFTVAGPGGDKIYAPYGVAAKGSADKNKNKIIMAAGLIALGFVGVGFALGKL